jgi:two-component system nitrogen regulation response regulator GlnG
LLPILYITAQAGSKTAIEAIKRGAFEYLSKPIDFKLLLQRVAEAIEYRHLTRLPVLVDIAPNKESESDVLVGRCRGMQEVYKSIGRLSNLRSPILIEGEIGTGKEMIARAIHQNGSHASGGFRKIACNEFEDSSMQIELFGGIHSKPLAPEELPTDRPSAKRIPALLNCSGGTLMIDDIDNLSVAGQSRLLRFFQSNSIDGISADTRVILATSSPIRDLVQSGRTSSNASLMCLRRNRGKVRRESAAQPCSC